MKKDIPISGKCDPAFEPVREVFLNNFLETSDGNLELGAGICVFLDGRKIIDLWGGYTDKDKTLPWQKDTLVGIYSSGKPLVALGVLKLIDSGELKLDAPVCQWWPEFAAGGKEKITVRQVLCHQAGLPSIRKRMPEDSQFDWQVIADALAEQTPWIKPGVGHVYHTNTYGFLLGELVRRVRGISYGTWFDREIAGPLQAEVYFGVKEMDLSRCAELVWRPSGDAVDPSVLDQEMSEEERMVLYGYINPPGFSSQGIMNTKKWRMAEIPSSNGHGTAVGLAKIYNVLAQGGSNGGFKILSSEILSEATSLQSEGPCPALKRDVSFGLGFQLTRPDRPLGPGLSSFGHYGTGGSLGFADPDIKLGFGYVMNDIIPRWQNPRNRALVNAVYDCL